VAVFEAPDAWPEPEERVRLDAHSKQLGDDEMAEFVNVYSDAEYENYG
jgi:hypothetical protein